MSESLSHVEEGVARIGFAQSVNQSSSEKRQLREVLRIAPEVLMGLETGEAVAQLTDGRTLEGTRRIRTPRAKMLIGSKSRPTSHRSRFRRSRCSRFGACYPMPSPSTR